VVLTAMKVSAAVLLRRRLCRHRAHLVYELDPDGKQLRVVKFRIHGEKFYVVSYGRELGTVVNPEQRLRSSPDLKNRYQSRRTGGGRQPGPTPTV
jgi:hypothetical protein